MKKKVIVKDGEDNNKTGYNFLIVTTIIFMTIL